MNNVGIVTARDGFTIQNTKVDVQKTIEEFLSLDDESARKRFDLGKDVRDWQVNFARSDLQKYFPEKGKYCKISYRPFDDRWTFYTGKSRGFHCYPRVEIMQHFLKGENLGLIIGRQGQVVGSMPWNLAFVTNAITDFNLYYRGGGMSFPLYLYPESIRQKNLSQTISRIPNLDQKIVIQIAEKLGLIFRYEKEKTENTFAPVDVLDYIYAILYSPIYRERYKEFLKIDFPRIPYPKDQEAFWRLVKLGGELRQIHLLESPLVNKFITTYPVRGSNEVTKLNYADGKVWINVDQYFDHVPQVAWEFYIGGYQPAQKWLKDRKGRLLSYEDIQHYQKIIVALVETDRLMKEIDVIKIA